MLEVTEAEKNMGWSDFYDHLLDNCVGRQYYTYDFNSYVSDFGGYLGLLLGYSIMSFFDMAWELFTYFIKKGENQEKVTSG